MGNFKKAIVITGSIGSGKSTLSNILKLHGYAIIDADLVAHEILNGFKDEISQKFGSHLKTKDGIDRKALGKIVFNDKDSLKWLENLLHKPIKDEIYKRANECEVRNFWYFVDIPLYFERGDYTEFDKVLLVYAPEEILIKRVAQREQISEFEAQKRVNLQQNIEEKRKKANFIIDNSKDLKWLNLEIENFIQRLENESF